MEAEITSSGDVVVEGQHVGQLNGFRFTPDPQAAGEEAKTLNAAAQKALASEIEGRATRVSEAVDEAFVLANDGLIRWLGEPVGRIIAGAHILEPQVRVIADEHLTGPALELVQRRVDLWIQQHVKKLLGSLADMEKGEWLDGMAKGIAFQIAEALGVLERTKVADDVKALPQDARGSLRKLGVRFGAYHLYLPALVKPAPRALAAQLWALKNGGVEGVKGLDEVPHLAASGRTSFVADQAVPKGFYRAAGFRVCGERAVRVDILERLADLIRPAIAYRPGTTPGDPPPGTADQDGFVVTVGMTSLAGCSGEAFGSILKSLGYVVDRRAGPAITVALIPKAATEPVKAPAPGDQTPGDQPAEATAEPDATPLDAVAPEAPVPVIAPTDGDLESRVSLARQSELIAAALEGGALDAIEPLAPAAEPEPEPEAAGPVADIAAPEMTEVPEGTAAPEGVAALTDTLEPDPLEPAPAEDAEIPMIEVWRPHRHNVHNNRRPAERNRGPRRPQRTADGAAPAAIVPAEGTATEPGPRPPRPEGSRGRFRDFKRPGPGEPGGREGGGGRPPGGGRRDQGGPRRDENRQGGMHTSEKPKPREKQPDPNSPFAKLAALKAQMEQDKK